MLDLPGGARQRPSPIFIEAEARQHPIEHGSQPATLFQKCAGLSLPSYGSACSVILSWFSGLVALWLVLGFCLAFCLAFGLVEPSPNFPKTCVNMSSLSPKSAFLANKFAQIV